MGRKAEDLTGKRFGRWTVIKRNGSDKYSKPLWMCRCDCGTIKDVLSKTLKSGESKSCGCLVKEKSTKHGMYKSRLNKEYRGIKQRCYNPKNTRYSYYGEKGIHMCDEWLGENGFVNFMNWSLSHGYTDELTIDRIDVNGNYEPSNCRWVDKKAQANNRTTSHFETYKGETHTLSEWEDITGISQRAISERLIRGWSIEKTLTTPLLRG